MSKTSLKGENIGKEDLSPMDFSESESSTMHISSTAIPLFNSLNAHEQQNSTTLPQNARPTTSQGRRSATYRSQQRVAKRVITTKVVFFYVHRMVLTHWHRK